MKLPDVNVLIAAANHESDRFAEANRWLKHALAGPEPIGFAWTTITGFVRLATKRAVFQEPLSVDDAFDAAKTWLSTPAALVVDPGELHLEIMRSLLTDLGTAGNLVPDAHLAALALENHATVVSYDADFGRFAGVRWERPAVA